MIKRRLIVEKLYEKARWAYPDIRATVSLKEPLHRLEFEEVVANLLTVNNAQLVALHKEEKFDEPFRAEFITANTELVTFIAA